MNFTKTLKAQNRYVKIALAIVAVCITVIVLGMALVALNKKRIIANITGTAGNAINAKISIGDVKLSIFKEFPYASVHLSDVLITDSMYAEHKIPLLKAADVYLSINPAKIFSKELPVRGISLENADFNLFTDSLGYTDTYVLKIKKNGNSPAKDKAPFPVKKIDLLECRFTLVDQQKDKKYDISIPDMVARLRRHNNKISIDADANLLVNELSFNTRKGSYLVGKTFKGKLGLDYITDSSRLRFQNMKVDIDRQPLTLTGFLDLGKIDPQFSLNIQTQRINYIKVQEFLPAAIAKALQIVHIEQPLKADIELNGPMKGGEPLIAVKATGSKTKLLTPFLDFDGADFDAFYTNQVNPALPRHDSNSVIKVTRFEADWHEIPVQSSNFEILNLTTPLLTANLVSKFGLDKLNEFTGSTLRFGKGEALLALNYKGPIVRNDQTNSLLNGEIKFSNGEMLYVSRNIQADKMSGTFQFNNSNLIIPQLALSVLGNNFKMNGRANNLLSILNTEPNKANVNWNISVPSLDLTSLTGFLRKKQMTRLQKANTNSADDFANKLDKLLDEGRFDLNLSAGDIHFKKFRASSLNADVSLLQNDYLLNRISLRSAAGNITASGNVRDIGKENKVDLKAKFSDVNVNDVFTYFNNFGQDAIEAKNLGGILNADINASLRLDESGGVVPASVVSTVDFNLRNGSLTRYEPLKKIQKFIFKKRNFDYITFAPIKSRFEIADRDIKINRMEISSSVLRMFIEGTYSLKGNTDISIQVPFSNLKKMDPDDVPENIGVNTRVGRSLFLRGIPVPGTNEVTIALDVFKNYYKEKRKEEEGGAKKKSRKQ